MEPALDEDLARGVQQRLPGLALSAINIWTGAPLMFAACLGLIWVLGWASATYDRVTGRPQTVKRHVPWLRSMRAERVDYERERTAITSLERILVSSVVLAILAFELWFFIASPSPIEPGPSKD